MNIIHSLPLTRDVALELSYAETTIKSSRFKDYKIFNASQLGDIAFESMSHDANGTNLVGVIRKAGEICGWAYLAKNEWDSKHFSMPMYRLELSSNERSSHQELTILVEKVLSSLGDENRYQHITCHINSDNYLAFNALIRIGFNLSDTKITYVCRKRRASPLADRRYFKVRPYQKQDYHALMGIISTSQFHSRFTRDPNLDPKKVREVYPLWLEKLLSGPPETHQIYVAERQGEPVGCGGIALLEDVERITGRRILGKGIFMCSQKGIGSYLPISDAMVQKGLEHHDTLEATITLSNNPAARALSALGYLPALSQHVLYCMTSF